MVIFSPFLNIIKFYREKLLSTTQYTVDILLKFCVVILILATFLVTSIFLYLTIYNTHVPDVMNVYPVHFYYEECAAESVKLSQCKFPRGHVELTKESQLLMIGQEYKVSLVFDMPESPSNKDAGMFMICTEIVSKNSVTLGNSCRPTSLRYRSQLVTTMTALALAPFYIAGSIEEKQTISLTFYEDFKDSKMHPATGLNIELKSHQAQIYTAQLQITAQMSGLRYLMFYWRTTSAIFGITFIFGCVTFIASLSLYQLYGPHNESGGEYMYENFEKLKSHFNFLQKPKSNKSSSEEENENDDDVISFVLKEGKGETKEQIFHQPIQRLESSSEA